MKQKKQQMLLISNFELNKLYNFINNKQYFLIKLKKIVLSYITKQLL